MELERTGEEELRYSLEKMLVGRDEEELERMLEVEVGDAVSQRSRRKRSQVE